MYIKEANLFYTDLSSNSDKEYHLQLIEVSKDSYTVNCRWGRRGSTLQSQSKVVAVPLSKAESVYEKVLNEKVGKGYQIESGSSASYVTPKTETPKTESSNKHLAVGELKRKIQIQWDEEEKFIPQLLNPIDESEVEAYLHDDAWGAQEKKNGKHQELKRKDAITKAFNKKGKEIGYPQTWAEDLSTDGLLDGEAIGQNFHTYDLLEVDGQNLRMYGYKDRYDKLCALSFGRSPLTTNFWNSIKVVPLAIGYKAKKALYDRLLKEGKEGIVFKRLTAVYTPGKAHSDMVKLKFYSTASVRVAKGREGKRSIGMEILDGSKWIFIGNCTIPPNKECPNIGDIVEIRYLDYQEGGALYQPTYLEVRDDTDPEECLKSQLKYKAKED